MRVREATIDDLGDLIHLAGELHPHSTFAHLDFDAWHFGNFVNQLIAGPEHVVLVVEYDGVIVGGLLASVVPASISPDLVASEHAFYVSPDMRSSGAGQALLEAYLAWARKRGAKRVNAGNSAGMNDERYVRLMGQAGFERVGSLMYQNL